MIKGKTFLERSFRKLKKYNFRSLNIFILKFIEIKDGPLFEREDLIGTTLRSLSQEAF